MRKIIYPVKRWMFKSASWNGYWVEANTKGDAMQEARKVLKRENDGNQVFELQRYDGDELDAELRIGRWAHGVYADGSTW